VSRLLRAGLAALALALAGCGGPSADLFGVERTGRAGERNAELKVVVNDAGFVICNDDINKPLDAEQLLEARELSRQLADLAQLGIELPPGEGSLLSYRVNTQFGDLTFSDTSADKPPAFDRLVAFVKRMGEDVCGLER
jgi:hypothetical protein